MKIDDLTHTIIGCAYKVHRALGAGFLEKVYENALKIELEHAGIFAKQQEKLLVWYEGQDLRCEILAPCGARSERDARAPSEVPEHRIDERRTRR